MSGPVSRFDRTKRDSSYCYGCYTMTEDAEGVYVRYEDYARLKEELAHAEENASDWKGAHRAMVEQMEALYQQPAAEAQEQGGVEAGAWRHPDALPLVEPGQQGWFWVAVRRAHSGRIYSYPATYLNAMVLADENGDQEESRGNRYHHGPVDEDEGTFEATGWHDVKEHYEYSAVYSPLLESDRDELIAWRAVPEYSDTAAPSAPVGVSA